MAFHLLPRIFSSANISEKISKLPLLLTKWVSQLTRIDFQQISQFFRIFSAKYMVNYHNPTQVPSTIAFKKSEMF